MLNKSWYVYINWIDIYNDIYNVNCYFLNLEFYIYIVEVVKGSNRLDFGVIKYLLNVMMEGDLCL